LGAASLLDPALSMLLSSPPPELTWVGEQSNSVDSSISTMTDASANPGIQAFAAIDSGAGVNSQSTIEAAADPTVGAPAEFGVFADSSANDGATGMFAANLTPGADVGHGAQFSVPGAAPTSAGVPLSAAPFASMTTPSAVPDLGSFSASPGNGVNGSQSAASLNARVDVADVLAPTGQRVKIDAGGHALTDVHAVAAPAGTRAGKLPLGMFDFKVHDVAPGGGTVVHVTLPASFVPSTWLIQNPTTGALEPFDFDGTTGAEIKGNVVTLHFVDGRRGDADGVANGVIADPGGPDGDPEPYVRLKAIDPTAAKYAIDSVHGTSTGAFAVYRGGDLTNSLAVNYTVDSSSTAVAGQDYQALTGTVIIQSGQFCAGVLVQPLDNAAGNSSKTVGISLNASDNYIVGTPGVATVTISETNTIHPQPYMLMGNVPMLGVETLDINAGELPDVCSTGLMLIYRTALVTNALGGGGVTWTNPAAVTAYYTVSETGPGAGTDFVSLPGSAFLDYGVFASELKIVPINDTQLQGTETITVTLSPNPSYQIDSPSANVYRQDDEEPPVPPQANPDEFAMSADDSSLSIPASGVLYNDYAFSPGAMTAVLKANPSYGALNLNSNGSFVYTPNSAIQASGGNDSFQYAALQNGLLSNWAVVTIHVVRITITTPGLPHNQNLTTGAYVPINANDDNGSLVRNEIPDVRDFQLDGPPGEPFRDPDLIEVDVTVNPNLGLPGFFTISVQNHGIGQIRLWRDQFKVGGRAEGVYAAAELPTQFFIEGTEPSDAMVESVISVDYTFLGANGVPAGAGSDSLNATVTPVITNFTVTGNGVEFTNPLGDGLLGMETGRLVKDLPGASFDATVSRRNLVGNVTYIQNLSSVENGTNGAAGGAVFTNAPTLNIKPNPGVGPPPWLDTDPESAIPDYESDPAYPVDNANTQRRTDADTPELPPPNGAANLTAIDVVFRLRLYLVWRWGSPGTGIIYTLAYRNWYVVFRADKYVQNKGVTRVLFPDGVVAPGDFVRSHENPIVTPPVANNSSDWR
jgi:hypothetical protein